MNVPKSATHVWYKEDFSYVVNGKEFEIKKDEKLEIFGYVKGGIKVFTNKGHILDIAWIPGLMEYECVNMIYMVSNKKDKVYPLTDTIYEMMRVEIVTLDFAINYFMDGLKCDCYRIFPPNTPTSDILAWVAEGDTEEKTEGSS